MKRFFILFCILIMCLIELTSCGEDTSSWPTYELPFECKQITCIELSFIEKPYKKNNNSNSFFKKIEEVDEIVLLYEDVNHLKYSKKKSLINKDDYWEFVQIRFYIKDETFDLNFYSYGVTEGYLTFNEDEAHKFTADFVSMTYGKYKNIEN